MTELDRLLAGANALLFDFDGVLADSEWFHFEAYRVAFERRGHAMDVLEYWRYWSDLGEGAPGEIRRHGLSSIDPDEIVAEKRVVFDRWAAEGRITLRPGAAELLADVSESSLPAAIASNTAASTIGSLFAARTGTSEVPVPVIGAPKGLRKKPFPDIFLEGARVLGVPPEGCVVVEDARKGVEAARAAGMEVVLLRNGENRTFDYPEARVEIGSLEELRRALARSRR